MPFPPLQSWATSLYTFIRTFAANDEITNEKLPSPKAKTLSIRDILQSYLQRIEVPYNPVPLNDAFSKKCAAVAITKGYHMDGPDSLRRYLPGGVMVATLGYAHLQDEDVQIYICLYTALLLHLDDAFQMDVTKSAVFNERFVRNQPQDDALLDNMADHLKHAYDHFSVLAANMIITSTLNFAAALTLDFETKGMKMHPRAVGYPSFSRAFSGGAEAYGMFVFPKHLPIRSFIQALPDLMMYISDTNDVLSFHKEEVSGEEYNRVSLLADCCRTSKLNVVLDLASSSLGADDRICQILASEPECYRAYMGFRKGYIDFHSSVSRYRLQELQLQ